MCENYWYLPTLFTPVYCICMTKLDNYYGGTNLHTYLVMYDQIINKNNQVRLLFGVEFYLSGS